MIYGSVCSGIEAATVAWHPLGWKAAFFAEIDRFPCSVLAHHYPDVVNVGDFTRIQEGDHGAIDVLVAGTPCQDFSVAGLRSGMEGKRGQLTVEFAQLAGRLRPRWLVWENVPGILSIDEGRAFGTFLGLLGQLGYGLAYRILDAQYFRIPQRRRRVFVVGYLGDWRRAAAVLFERSSLSGHPAPCRQARQVASSGAAGGAAGGGRDDDGGCISVASEVSPTLRAGGNRTGGDRPPGTDADTVDSLIAQSFEPHHDEHEGRGVNFKETETHPSLRGQHGCDNTLIAHCPPVVPQAMSSKWAKYGSGPAGDEVANLVAFQSTCGSWDPLVDENCSPPVKVGSGVGIPSPPAVAIRTGHTVANGWGISEEVAHTLDGTTSVEAVAHALRADGFDASEDGSGRGTPLIAFSAKDHGADVQQDLAPTLRAGGHDKTHANSGNWAAIAFQSSQSGVREVDQHATLDAHNGSRRHNGVLTFNNTGAGWWNESATASPIRTPQGSGSMEANVVKTQAVAWTEEVTACEELAGTVQYGGQGGRHEGVMTPAMAVRRLTPLECERLQGFPDGYTKLTEKTPDGPRYKALGNAFAVPVMRWIGERIEMVEKIASEQERTKTSE